MTAITKERKPKAGPMLLLQALRDYPRRTLAMVAGLLLAGIAEGIGVATILPILSVMGNGPSGSTIEKWVSTGLSWINLEATLPVLLVGLVASLGLKAALTILAMRQVGYTTARLAMDLRSRLVQGLLHARWEYFIKQPIGNFANAVGIESQNASVVYQSGAQILAALFQTLAYMLLALLLSWQVTLMALAAGLFIIYGLRRLVGIARAAGHLQAQHYQALVARLSDGLYGLKTLKAMGWEDRLGPLLKEETTGLNNAMRQQVVAAEVLRGLQEPITAVFLAVGLYAALSFGSMAGEEVLMLGLLFARTMSRVSLLQKHYQGLLSNEGFYQGIHDKIRAVEAVHEVIDPSKDMERFSGEISLDDVSLLYGTHKVLDRVSLKIPFGSIVLLTGPSGAGKTSLVDLVVGLVKPSDGNILIDGHSLESLNLREWRRQIGYVPQDSTMFHDTIRANVTLNDPDISDDQTQTALKKAEAWNFVEPMPLQLDEVVGERGARLSGGQRQRIAIARALVRYPSLLVLDEATAALDAQTELDIIATLNKLRGSMTILAIAHQSRLTDIANLVYSLSQGRISPLPNHNKHPGTEVQQ